MIGFFKKLFSSKPIPIAEQYDERGFNVYGDHINGTKYDDKGFDLRGFATNGYNAQSQILRRQWL